MADAHPPKLEMLKSTDQVLAYLSSVNDTTFPEDFRHPKSVTELTTGIGNGVHRLTFTTPLAIRNETSASTPPSTAILKHSTPYVFQIGGQTVVWDLWPFELYALRDVPNTAFVKTPEVYWVDESNRVMITEDAGPGSTTLKNLLLGENIPDATVFRKIGQELGRYLSGLHKWGQNAETLRKYENKDARVIASWRTCGRLEEALAKEYPDLSQDTKEKVKIYCDKEKSNALESGDTVIMGDFWTGNVLVNLNKDGELESLYIVDWEMIRPSDAATELSQMVAEVWEAGDFSSCPDAKAAAKHLTLGLCSEYKSGMGQLPEGILREVMLGAGAHVTVWVSIGFAEQGNELTFKKARDSAMQVLEVALEKDVRLQTDSVQDWGVSALR
ncbi:hypothetical protein Dda_6600 [Drechslerella dactyloides]|uniref:Aminoglycoside phosphotransferase domain-containing protein n=1 Tax=Drechslerella dactyloides TaxID=74499 RepID=A0AAD6IXQ0_DREDA|nr:hypothetical protein Dda_6600 [Drechslerella dactyloides]